MASESILGVDSVEAGSLGDLEPLMVRVVENGGRPGSTKV